MLFSQDFAKLKRKTNRQCESRTVNFICKRISQIVNRKSPKMDFRHCALFFYTRALFLPAIKRKECAI